MPLDSSPAVRAWLERHDHEPLEGRLIGGNGALSEQLAGEVRAAIVGERSTGQMIRAAYEAGDLSIDDAARYSLFASLDPDRVPDGLRGDPAQDEEEQGSHDIIAWWGELQEETRAELADYLTIRPSGSPAGAAFAQQWTDCDRAGVTVGSSAYFCIATITPPGTSVDLAVYYSVGTFGVAPTDADGNGRPDLIDLVIDATSHAWQVYESDGFAPPAGVDIVLEPLMFSGGGLALPPELSGIVRGTIWLDTDEDEVSRYLPRHELFHQFQYNYITAVDYAAHRDGMAWWLEATANWAAGEADRDPGATTRTEEHATPLRHVLGEPELRFDEARTLSGGPEYGSFIVAEYLAQLHGGAAVIEETLRRSGEGLLGRNPPDVVADAMAGGGTFADALMTYRQWAYVLERDGTLGFTTPDVSQYWRPALQADPRTRGGDESSARPHRTIADLTTRQYADGFEILEPTGATYIDLVMPAGEDVALEVQSSAAVQAAVLSFDGYPRQCQPVTELIGGGEQLALTVSAAPGCSRLTLIISNGDREATASVVWRASLGVDTPPVGNLVLSGQGVADHIRFGDDADAVLAAVSAVLGDAISDTGWEPPSPCLAGDGLGDFRAVTFDGLLGVGFRRDPVPTFVSWGYFLGAPGLQTARGISLGSTNQQVADAYPEATFDQSVELRPTWRVPPEAGGPFRAFPIDSDPDSPIVQLLSGAEFACP